MGDDIYTALIPHKAWPENFVAFDFETATKNQMACSLGIVEVANGSIISQWSSLIQPPENHFDEVCCRINGICPTDTANSSTFAELWPSIRHYFNNRCLVAHNISFDLSALQKNLAYYGIKYEAPLRIFDTCELLGYSSLVSAAEYFGIKTNLEHHKALDDALMCAKLMMIIPEYEGKIINIPRSPNDPKLLNIRSPHDAEIIKQKNLSHNAKQQDLEHCVNKNTIFYDKKVVITGTINLFPMREELAMKLKSYGADINTSISKKTNIVVMGKNAGPSKMAKIKEINESGIGSIRIIEEQELIELLAEYDKATVMARNQTDTD
jgi:DNA polymerase-3 subunit epsilon